MVVNQITTAVGTHYRGDDADDGRKERILCMMMMMSRSPFGQCSYGRPLRGMVVNQITTAVGTHDKGFLAIHFV
jgi:hypothetical protein